MSIMFIISWVDDNTQIRNNQTTHLMWAWCQHPRHNTSSLVMDLNTTHIHLYQTFPTLEVCLITLGPEVDEPEDRYKIVWHTKKI